MIEIKIIKKITKYLKYILFSKKKIYIFLLTYVIACIVKVFLSDKKTTIKQIKSKFWIKVIRFKTLI